VAASIPMRPISTFVMERLILPGISLSIPWSFGFAT
jgi:hypothetical protein